MKGEGEHPSPDKKAMYIDYQTVITIAAVLAAVIAIVGYYNKAYRWVQKQDRQDTDISAIKSELTLLTYGTLACLKGLAEQGCDGPVHEAIEKIEKHLNVTAHK